MNEDMIVTQIGLIFSQVRYIRMAMDQIERSTARYAGVAIYVAAAGPGRWGAPPMEAGALRVYVVNLTDLIAPDNSFLGVLSSIFRFVTSSIGGLIGGAISGLALPVIVAELADIARSAVQILRMMGLSGQQQTQSQGRQDQQTGTLLGLLDRVNATADRLANILGLTNQQQQAGQATQTAESRVWLDIMQSVERIVQGLILLVPILISAFASLLVRIDQLKIGILDLLEFVMRNVLLLRGIILVTLYDTIAGAARLAGQLLAILATGAGNILSALFRMLEAAVAGVFSAIQFLSSALTSMVNALLPWLVRTVFLILEGIGRLPIFRLIFAFVEILPTMLPPILGLMGKTLSDTETTNLEAARTRMVAGLASSSTALPALPAMPDFANLPGVQSAFAGASAAVSGVTSTMQTQITGMLGSASGMMTRVAGAMESAVGPGGARLTENLETSASEVTRSATSLTASLRTARQTALETSGTGLEPIANAYQQWLTGGGLQQILRNITEYFRSAPAASAPPETSPLGLAVQAAQEVEPARPTVEIADVVVEITAARTEGHGGTATHHASATELVEPETELADEELFARGMYLPA